MAEKLNLREIREYVHSLEVFAQREMDDNRTPARCIDKMLSSAKLLQAQSDTLAEACRLLERPRRLGASTLDETTKWAELRVWSGEVQAFLARVEGYEESGE